MFDIYYVRYKKIIFIEEMRIGIYFLELMNLIDGVWFNFFGGFIRKLLWKLDFLKIYICKIKYFLFV